jgi:hypothetical protein
MTDPAGLKDLNPMDFQNHKNQPVKNIFVIVHSFSFYRKPGQTDFAVNRKNRVVFNDFCNQN